MKNNPVYKREMLVRSRSFRIPLIILIFNGILALVALLNMYQSIAQVKVSGSVTYENFLQLYTFVAALEFMMLMFIMPALTSASISGERERQTLDLMLTTCMTPADIVIGKLEAALGTMFLMIVSSLPILAMVFVYGGVTPEDLLLLFCCFFVAAVFTGSIGLLCSALFRRTTAATVAAYAAAAVVTVGTYGINYLVHYINRSRIGAYLSASDAAAVSGGSGRLLYLLIVNPIATFAQVIGRFTAGSQIWVEAGNWFGNETEGVFISHWISISMVLQLALTIVLVAGAIKTLERSHE